MSEAETLSNRQIDRNMSRVLILYAHPAPHKSRVNHHLIRAAQDVDQVTVHDLYETYPDFLIDVEAEQTLLLEHDAVVFHHPFYWYSSPSILKEWQDLVLQHGWAYGSEGTSLQGKHGFSAITAGGGTEAYCPQGTNRRGIRDFLVPFEATFQLCGMVYHPPFLVYSTHSLEESDILGYAEQYRRLLTLVVENRIDWNKASDQACSHLNRDIDSIAL